MRHTDKVNIKGKQLTLECRHYDDGSFQLKVGDAVFTFRNESEWLKQEGLLPEFYLFLHFKR